ncbi:MAG TPA: tyrosine-type recombinase/integrase [Candidatus Sulfotelmatobacter sp.]|nr:tyrosine-type recombinase/integrase [Candidatus Sulfotelmatobacter sp.]
MSAPFKSHPLVQEPKATISEPTIRGPIEPLVDATAAAQLLILSPRRVIELARRGSIPAYSVVGAQRHLWRFRLSELACLYSPSGYNASGSLTCLEEKSKMAQRHQRGWLKKEQRKEGETWMLFFRTTRESDGKRVEQKIAVGAVREFPTKGAAWAEVERQQIQINKPDFRRRVTFTDLAQHYEQNELGERRSGIVDPKAHTTVAGYKRVLRNRLLPRWGKRFALSIEPLEIEEWLSAVKQEETLENPTLDRMRRVMSLVYKHGQRFGLIPRREECNPMRFVRCKTTSNYEAVILTPQQAFTVLMQLEEPERTLTLLASATGLRISECLGLQWQDVSFEYSQIHVRRTWTCGKVGLPKSRASKAPVPLHPLLAEFMQAWKNASAYAQSNDWVFASLRCKGKQPRVANMLVEDHLRPAAVKAKVIAEGDPCRFGFHNLRHSLASFLVRSKTDPKTVQALLRHSDVKTTLQLYAHSVSADRMTAQGEMLQAILSGASSVESGLNAD